MSKPIKILVIRLSAMGDVAIAIPILNALLHQHNNIQLTVLTKAFFAPIFKVLPNINVIYLDTKKEHKTIFGLYKLAKQLKKENFDIVADIHNVLRTNLLKLFLCHKNFAQIDKGRKEKKQLISGKLFHQLPTTHQRYASVFEKLGYPIDLNQPYFIAKEPLTREVKKIFAAIPENKIIGIAPFAAHKGKTYSLHLMKLVVEQLSKKHNILLFGGKNDIAQLQSLQLNKNVVLVAGKFTFEEEIALLSHLDIMLSMDSGNAHLAAMFGVKTITIWGVTHPFAGFAPYHQPQEYLLLADKKQFPLIPTSVFGNNYPKNYENAADSVGTKTVIKTIEKALLD